MAIAFGAIGTKAGVGTTTEAIAYPASVGAGDLLLACRCIWLGTATADDEPGWTAAGRLSGGTGTAVDDHTTIAAADWTEAAGGETGSVTFDQTGATGIMAAMLRYTKGAGTTWDVAAQTGDDATHGTDRSVTLSSSHTVAVGDWVVAVVAVDTNTTLAGVASPAFSGTATFGTVNRRTSGTGTSTGNDGNIEVWDAEVTGAGTCTGFSFTTTTTQCGPIDIVRLREVSGSTPVAATDTGSGADAANLAAALTASDTGAGADSGALAASQAAADTGTGADSASSSAALAGSSDTGTGADTASVVVNVTATDTAVAVDAATVDTGSGDASKTGSDTAAGTEAGTTAASTTATDAAATTDTAAVTAAPTASDTATATESATVTVILATSDAATATDLAALAATVAAAELAATLEAASYVDPGVVVGAAPAARTMVVPAESRVLTVAAESRTLIVPAENRTLEA